MSHKIVVRHSSIVINDYKPNIISSLEGSFSIYDKLYHKEITKGIEYIESENKLIVPRGIDINYLEYHLKTDAFLDTKCDPYDTLPIIKLKYKPRDNIQKEALDFMIGGNKYYYNREKSQLSVNLNTGVGKSYCSITTTALLRMRSMIITNSIDWLNQWKNYILEYTDTLPSEIFFIVGTPSIKSLLKKDINQYKFILASHDTIKSYGDKNGWDKVTELFKFCRIGLKFYDEAHLYFSNICKIDFYTNTFRTYYVTATPARSNMEEDKIYSLYFKNIPAIDLFNEDRDPHTKYLGVMYNSHPTPIDISNCSNVYGFDKNKYSVYVVEQENFKLLLHILINKALRNGLKNVFYIATNEAIEKVRDWLVETYPMMETYVGIYTSIIDKDKKMEQLNKRIILSTTKSLGAAVDVKGLKMVLVLAEPFGSKVLARQTLGRTRDDDTLYLDIVDNGFKSIRNYYRDKQEIFKKYALSTDKLVFTDELLAAKAFIAFNNTIDFLNNEILTSYPGHNKNFIDPIRIVKKDIPGLYIQDKSC